MRNHHKHNLHIREEVWFTSSNPPASESQLCDMAKPPLNPTKQRIVSVDCTSSASSRLCVWWKSCTARTQVAKHQLASVLDGGFEYKVSDKATSPSDKTRYLTSWGETLTLGVQDTRFPFEWLIKSLWFTGVLGLLAERADGGFGLAVLSNGHVNPPRACVHNKNNADVFVDTLKPWKWTQWPWAPPSQRQNPN